MTTTQSLLNRIGIVAFSCCVLSLPLAGEITTSYTGTLDATNANDVFTVTFVVPNPVPVTIQTYGYGGSANAPGGKNAAGRVISPGGFDSYVSIFYGTSSGAAFVASNDDGMCPPAVASPSCHDSRLIVVLPAGSYTLALTTFENFSFAENLGAGILGDGFIGLGSYLDSGGGGDRSPDYAVDIKIPLLVSNQVNVVQTGIGRNRSTGLWAATLTVTNKSSSPIAGPVQVLVSNLTTGVSLNNSSGTFVDPYITVSAGALAPGASASASLLFSNPSNGYINYTPFTYSGGLP